MNSTHANTPEYRFTEYPNGHIELTIRKELAAEFKALIQRGANLYPDFSPAIKELADLITSGTILQDYYVQANVKRPDPIPPLSI